MKKPVIGLIAYPQVNLFLFSVPYTIFNIALLDEPLFELRTVITTTLPGKNDNIFNINVTDNVNALDEVDIILIPGWPNVNSIPFDSLINAINKAYQRGALIVALCFGTYVLAHAGLLNDKKAATHWLAEQDFIQRFPKVKLDLNALYVEDGNIITSAGTGAGIDCCLYVVRKFYGAKIANKIARLMVIPPHREGGQAQYIEEPVAQTTQSAQINRLLDFLRENLTQSHSLDNLADRTLMSRSSLTRHFYKATGMTVNQWIISERLKCCCDLLETSQVSIEKIAELTGFKSSSALRQHFNKRYCTSPNQWRKTFTTMNDQ